MSGTVRRLEVAIAQGDLDAVRSLLDREPEALNAHFAENVGLTPLMWACRKRNAPIVRELLSRGADVDATNTQSPPGEGGNTALWFAAQGFDDGGAEIARLLLDHGAAVDTRCENGTTALYMAAAWVHPAVVELLLERGSDGGIRDADGATALEMLGSDLRWCEEQPSLNAHAERFRIGAPDVIAILESAASDAV
ncbi:MAG TPA: ankyrin repeat domain-containing protein [Chthonomonadaceae bacterium]|nr:ankyrin repeat domain-containing protein [Chthonomonadaceae bacterium]